MEDMAVPRALLKTAASVAADAREAVTAQAVVAIQVAEAQEDFHGTVVVVDLLAMVSLQITN
jgi:hypothetical protein